MSLSEIVVKVIGVVLAVVGVALLLSVIGLNIFGIALGPWWVAVLVGILFLGAGIYIIRGGNITV